MNNTRKINKSKDSNLKKIIMVVERSKVDVHAITSTTGHYSKKENGYVST